MLQSNPLVPLTSTVAFGPPVAPVNTLLVAPVPARVPGAGSRIRRELPGVAFACWVKVVENRSSGGARQPWTVTSGTRTRLAEHWHASERGDIEAEHAIYAAERDSGLPAVG